MARHSYSFECGGEKLASIGASWFVSYAYFDRIDQNSHRNWDRVSTVQYRTSLYHSSSKNFMKSGLKKFVE